jgi:hypothetical protein
VIWGGAVESRAWRNIEYARFKYQACTFECYHKLYTFWSGREKKWQALIEINEMARIGKDFVMGKHIQNLR